MTIQAAFNRSQFKWETYMFQGDQYLSYRLAANTVSVGPRGIAVGWPGLAGTQFAEGIDAMVPFSYPPVISTVPLLPTEKDYVYIFRGDQYVRYDFANEEIIYGPLSIDQYWPGMKDVGFDRDIDAAFMDHRGDFAQVFVDTYIFFKGDKYITYDPRADKVSGGPYSIADRWPGLKEAGFGQGIDAVVFNVVEASALGGNSRRECYFVKGDKVLHFDIEDWKPLTGARSISDFWPGLKGTEYAAATPSPPYPQVKAHADVRIAFNNPGENNPNPYGWIELKTKSGQPFRIWTQQNQGNSTPARAAAAPSMNLPFTSSDIASVGAYVDEYDALSGDDFLARGSKNFVGNGRYTLSSDDGSVDIDITVTDR
ncbi:hypothetical protein GPA10_24135 [Streptomyces sp. p1417]|uniref:Hemopexin n=1 Tax=Streptomyces typhae TaxID=2681492 RepID=A0A6L6X1Q6_9ACTN|nr:hemopexin repeat-containing protein [Streptomyces typhae]MVO87764.1 hypothetical protein [Streptomyces typhae]